MDFCFDLESFGSGLFVRMSWMLTYPGRKFLEPENHAALALFLPSLYYFTMCAQSCKFMENKMCPTVLSVWGGKKEMT